MATTMSVEGDVVRVAVQGRLDGEDVDTLAQALRERLDTGRDFGVVFDRRELGAPTKAGREALERWGSADLEAMGKPCAGWADVYDERRAASLTRAAENREGHEKPAYPYRMFTDVAEAHAWASQQLASRRSTGS